MLDRHEHGGLPDTIPSKTYNIAGMGFHMDATFTQDSVTGHVTVECHCALCERFRRVMSHDEGSDVKR